MEFMSKCEKQSSYYQGSDESLYIYGRNKNEVL